MDCPGHLQCCSNVIADIVTDQRSIENPANEIYDDENLSNKVPRISFQERGSFFSRPSSPNDKIITTELPSSERLPTQKNKQEQVGSIRPNKLPFLQRIHSGHFHICLGLCSQTVLWKTLEENYSSVIHIPLNLAAHFTSGLWFVALLSFVLISGSNLLKCLFHFETVRMEYFDRVRVNYFFVPWIAAVLLRLGLPSSIAPDKVHPLLFCIFIVPFSILELKIYGQWFTKGKRCLARFANPSTYFAIIGNFVIARLAAKVRWRETAMFFLTVGLIHYAVVFITLYQRLPSDVDLSRKISPVFFLFIAAPSSASVAWEALSRSFDSFSRMLLFLSLFLYLALVVRVDFFCNSIRKFSVIWWSFAYPMTTTSVATLNYAEQVKYPIARTLAYVLTCVSIIVPVTALQSWTQPVTFDCFHSLLQPLIYKGLGTV
ncbi:guard cell S-type anion channel SLAC1-like [Cryptomeria japonica]|uniref:guard cell S-type anion channel SLAC1-like n=1 Tax=Cryptomeria japonica TaxID=3369 RepID=UPI0027DA239D|nr:guard cell S-type anion channel SLAC1-like [Cryptomeria japonica]